MDEVRKMATSSQADTPKVVSLWPERLADGGRGVSAGNAGKNENL